MPSMKGQNRPEQMHRQVDLPKPGQIWRKDGPCDWLLILRVLMEGSNEYDGGTPGCVVRMSNGADRAQWGFQCFISMGSMTWRDYMRESGRHLLTDEELADAPQWVRRQVEAASRIRDSQKLNWMQRVHLTPEGRAAYAREKAALDAAFEKLEGAGQ